MWRRFAELGLLGLPFVEEDGGYGASHLEVALVMEAFGRALVVEPYLTTVVLAGGLLRHLASPEQRLQLVPRIAAGDLLLVAALAERQSRYSLNDVATRAEPDGDAFRLTGAKTLVLHGDTADALLVSARVEGDERDREGIGIFLVEAEAPGVGRRGYNTQDGQRAAEIELAEARGIPLGAPTAALPGIERMRDDAIVALAAEAVGVMGAMHDMTVEYLKTRQQFGRAIGTNQSLQHRAVDMYVSLEQARSMSIFATMMASEDDTAERERAMHATMVQIGRSGRHIGQEAIQLHGGIGMTMEYAVGHYFKRMTMIDRLFGDADLHLASLARLGGLLAA